MHSLDFPRSASTSNLTSASTKWDLSRFRLIYGWESSKCRVANNKDLSYNEDRVFPFSTKRVRGVFHLHAFHHPEYLSLCPPVACQIPLLSWNLEHGQPTSWIISGIFPPPLSRFIPHESTWLHSSPKVSFYSAWDVPSTQNAVKEDILCCPCAGRTLLFILRRRALHLLCSILNPLILLYAKEGLFSVGVWKKKTHRSQHPSHHLWSSLSFPLFLGNDAITLARSNFKPSLTDFLPSFLGGGGWSRPLQCHIVMSVAREGADTPLRNQRPLGLG